MSLKIIMISLIQSKNFTDYNLNFRGVIMVFYSLLPLNLQKLLPNPYSNPAC